MRTRAVVTSVLLAISLHGATGLLSACAAVESPESVVPPETAVIDPPKAVAAAPIETAPIEAAPIAVAAAPVHAEDLPPLLGEIAAIYKRWHLVDEVPNLAGADCDVGFLGGPHISGSDPASAHVDKIFYLYASDVAAYWRSVGVRPERVPESDFVGWVMSQSGVTQVLVKEAFEPIGGHGRHVDLDAARRLEQTFRAGKPKGLFVMAKFAGAPEGTDEGWIYGTIAPNGKVTAAGVIDKCAACHGEQPDRVFGLPTRG
jgi:hypothetical protein